MRPAALRSTALGMACALALGCASFAPYEHVVAEQRDHLLRVDDHWVFVEDVGQGAPVVLLHGFGSSSHSWRKVVPLLARSYRVVAVDLYGFGWTERPEEQRHYTRSGQAALVRGVLDALELPSAHLVGHSYGGAIALTVAAESPERVRSLVLVDSLRPSFGELRRYSFANLPGVAWIITRSLLTRRVVEDGLHGTIVDDSIVTAELIDAYLDRLRVEGAAHAYRWLTEPIASEETPLDLTEIEAPILFLWGEEDATLDLAYGRQLAADLGEPPFVVLPEAAHLPMEDRPELVSREIDHFLTTPPATRLGHVSAQPPR